MAGNQAHAADLMQAYPEATSAECLGDGRWAVVSRDGYEPRDVKCPGCERDRLAAAIGAFVPPRFRDVISIPGAVTAWAERGQRAEGLYLAGQVGTGKTHIAWMATARWCRQAGVCPRDADYSEWLGGRLSPTVVFTRTTDLLDDLRPGADSTQRVRDCQHASLLVLDDIGAEKASEWTQERLYSIIDHRYAHCLPLIVTSNLPPARLAEQIGERAASRLAEICTVVPITGPDRRKPAA